MKIVSPMCIFLLIIVACNTPYYAMTNSMSGQPATLYLANGKALQGKINVRSFDDYSSISRVQFAEGGSNQYQDYYIKDIQSLFINGSSYRVKRLIGNEFWNGEALRFVKQLTAQGGRMDLFELERMVKNSSTGKNEKIFEFYIQLPEAKRNEVYNAESGKFTPNFDVKMSQFVQDCPALAAKIKSRNKDYFYPFVVNNAELRRKTVLLQIINDYNNCKN